MDMKKCFLISACLSLAIVFMLILAPLNLESQASDSNVNLRYKGHIDIYVLRAGGDWQLVDSKDNLITNIGKDFIKAQLTGSVNPNATGNISLSFDATPPSATWTSIPNELTNNSLARATATYASNGTGAWNYTYTWTASGAQNDIQLTGLHWSAVPGSDGNLFAAAQFASVNLAANDQLKIIWSLSVS